MKINLLRLIVLCTKQTLKYFLLQLLVMQVIMAEPSASQSMEDYHVSLKVRNQKLVQVLADLEKQTDFVFAYNQEVAKDNSRITLNLSTDLKTLLKKITEQVDYDFKRVDQNIYVVKSEAVNAVMNITGTQEEVLIPSSEDVDIGGTVLDERGIPIPGATVIVEGTNIGTVTDIDGKFSLDVEEGAALIISFIGYKSHRVVVGNQTTISVTLQEDQSSLDEVVVVGYGTQKRINLTGAVDQIGSELFENRPMTNLTQGLQGALPNVNIRLLDGKPTASPSINIRGATSIGQGGSALILIDGVEGDPSMLNPNDIESISVLKDAASAAIYGARAAFGVVLITTKSPQKDVFSVNYGANFSMKQPTVAPNYVSDGYTWGRMFNDAFFAWEGTYPQNVNKTLPFSQEYLAELERRSNDPSLPRTEIGPDGNYVYYESTDWYDLLYKDQLLTMEHNISVSRSSEKSEFMISGRLFDQEGLFRYNSDDYKMLNLRARGSIELFPWLRVNNNLDLSNRNYFNPLNVGEGGGIWRNIADEGHPLAPMLNPDGTLTHSGAFTVGDFYYGKNGISTRRRIVRNMTGFDADIIKDKLKLIGNVTYQNLSNDETRRRVQVPFSRTPGVIEYVGNQYNDLRSVVNSTDYVATNLFGEYSHNLGNHDIKLTGGINYELSRFNQLEAQRNGLIFEDADNINLALGTAINTAGSYEGWQIFGSFARLNYIFKDRYLLELNGRYDGSSKFPSNERYAFFPSASVGWRVSQESFWTIPEDIISHLQFRASYGSLGSGNISSYAFLETFSISQSSRILNGILPQKTSRPTVLPDGLTWETVTSKNVGFDLDMFRGKFRYSFDAYVRETTDMYTIGMTLPAVFGASSPRGNYADMRTTGWEMLLSYRESFELKGKPFGLQVNLNFSDNKAQILKYNNPNKFLNDYYPGMWIGEMWGYINDGYFTSASDVENHADQSMFLSTSSGQYFPGDIKLKDLNGDGRVTPGDNTVDNPGDRQIIGNSAPRYAYGINLSTDWNGFFVSAFFQGIGKQDWYPSNESNAFWGQYNRPYGDIPKWHLNEGIIWSEDNPDSFLPRYVTRLANRSGAILRERQSAYVMNASYIRLKNLQVGYNFSPQLLASLKGIKAARIFFSGENIWTLSPLYKIVDNIDVENVTAPSDQIFTSSNAGDGYNYPMLKSYTLGLNVTF
ncbi:SusC/RagA family TonB-linked outer membrane protein [Negadavirga shengliensis]|uniref:SusC/RagA family TonB-linked outer membrane protein n=1 Tax=Negadavirga shengliensis TaxID=1389218 RepID=A0ABV9SX83_9BACT